MSHATKKAIYRKHLKRGAAVFAAYAVIVVVSAVAYPSVRFAKPVKIAPDIVMSDGGAVFKGQQDFFGWPFRFLVVREEADRPWNADGVSRMRIVAVRFGWLAMALNLSAIIATYCLIHLIGRIAKDRRVRWPQIAVSMICVATLANVIRLHDREYLEPIPIYEDE